ncbi:MAG: hypothetical protein WAX84_00645, partial [Leptotrichiaceae bacterium]
LVKGLDIAYEILIDMYITQTIKIPKTIALGRFFCGFSISPATEPTNIHPSYANIQAIIACVNTLKSETPDNP